MRRRGIVRFARRKAERRLAVFGCTNLTGFAVKSVPLQKGIIFLFFETVWRTRALFVSRAHITRDGLAEAFGFSAFESDDFLRHTYSFSTAGAASSSVSSGPSSSVKPKSEVTD